MRSRSRFFFAHDLIGKPLHTFPDHALRRDERDREGTQMNELDFGNKQVLVVGGSSGIGNGIAQAFRAHGAKVAVCGTRASASEYHAGDGCNLEGRSSTQLDVTSPPSMEAASLPFPTLDVLVLSQG